MYNIDKAMSLIYHCYLELCRTTNLSFARALILYRAGFCIVTIIIKSNSEYLIYISIKIRLASVKDIHAVTDSANLNDRVTRNVRNLSYHTGERNRQDFIKL